MNTSINVFRLPFLGVLCACVILADAHAQSGPAPQGGSGPIVFETRPPGHTGGGLAIGATYFHGHTFRLHERTEITALGLGNLTGSAGATVFAALYKIDTSDTVPDAVNDSNLLAATLVEIPSSLADASGEISLVVEPGIYAILAGTGRHGATAGTFIGSLENTGTDSTPDAWSLPYSINAVTGAKTLQGTTTRFFIEGEVLPPSEPAPTQFLVETARPTAWWARTSFGFGEFYWGTRFQVTDTIRIQQAGSWLRSGSGDLFAAIVELDGPDANPLPVTHPGFMDTVAGVAMIGVGAEPRAYTGEFEDTELTPGDYALIIGSGLFGAQGAAGIMKVSDQIVLDETLVWTGSTWFSSGQNFRMFLSGEVLFPTMDVDPGTLDFEIHQGDAESATLSVGNIGEADLNWSIMISEAPLTAQTRGFQEIDEGFESVSQLPTTGWAMINNSEPLGTTNWFQGGFSPPAHQGPANSYINAAYHNTEGPDGTISNWLLTPELDLSDGVQLRFWTRVPTNSCCPDRLEIRLSTAGGSTDVGESALSTGDFGARLLTINEALVQGGYPEEWTEYTVTVPAQGASTSGRLAFRYFVTEAGSQAPNSNWLSIDTVSITRWDGTAVCTGPAEIPWLNVSPDTGTAPANESSDVDVSIDTAGLAEGEHSAQLCVSGDDPDNPLVAVPVGLTVLPPRTPELVFDPPALDFSDVNIGATGGPLTATFSNTGNADATGLNLALSGDFGLHHNDCGNALPVGHDCQVGIVFTALEKGPAAGALEVTADGGFSATLTLSGNGVDAPAPALEYGPESFAFELFPDEIDNREFVLGNLGAGDLAWSLETDLLGGSGTRGHDPSLDEPIAIPDFEIDAASNGGQPASFTLPAGEISRGEVVGFSFTGTVSGISGTPSWAFEMCMIVTAPDGSSYSVGGRFAVPGCGLHSWDFDGPDDGSYQSTHDNVLDSVPDAGAWTFTFHNAWHDPDAATMAWSDVTATLHKIPAPCLDPAAVDWLDIDPVSGTTAPGGEDTVTVSVDTGGLSEGEQLASLCLSSNDPDTPLAVIPVTLRVETPVPAISLNPESFEFEILQGAADGDVLAIANPGDADLEWNLLDAATARGDALILLDQNFDGGFPPSGWNALDEGNLPCPWLTSDDYGMDDWSGTARGAAVDSDACFDDSVPFNSVDTSLVSPPLNLAHVDNARIDFDLAYRHLMSPGRVTLDASTDGGQNWTVLRTWSSHFAYPDNPSLPVSVDLSNYDGESHVLLRWRYRAGWDWWTYVDNVVVSADPPENCYDPAVDTWLEAEPSSGTLEPEDTQLMDLQIDAAELPTGPYATALCIQSNVPGNPLVAVPVALNVTAPELTLDPAFLDFGQVEVGENGGPLTVTLTNTGSADLEIDEIAGPGGPFTSAGGTCDGTPFSLPPGDGCELDFVFSPVTIGATDGILTATGNAPSSPDEVTLSGTGIAAILEIDPASFSFELITGQSDTGMLTVGNAGNIDLDWSIAAESNCGAGNPVAWLSASPPAGTTAPDGATPVEVFVDAGGLAAERYDAVLCISGNALGAPQTEIPVSLSVTAPDLFFDPFELDFGDLEIGTGGLTLNAVLHNQGDSGATELDFLVPAGFDADTAACGDTLPAGENCEIAVTFEPSETGTVEGTLIVGSTEGAVAELVLTGKGIELGTLGVDPDQLHFTDVVVTTSRTLSFNVINSADPGANELEVSAISLESGAPAFAISRIDCVTGTVLPPGESCVVEITFSPAEVAVHQGTIGITTSDGQQIMLALSGTVLGDTVFDDRFEQP